MAKKLQLRRGTTTQHGSFTGAEGEVTIDTTKDTAVVHDGSNAGGTPLAKEDLTNVSSSTIAGRLSNDSIAPAKIGAGTLPSDVTVASANLVDGTIVNADVNASAAIDGTKISPNFGNQSVSTTGSLASGSAEVSALTVSHTNPSVTLNDTNNENDFALKNSNGNFQIVDIDESNRVGFQFGSDGNTQLGGNVTVGGTVDGRDVAADGTKLDGIESGATADQTAAEIKTLVGNATDSNVFTDADHSKLDGIEAGATGDQTNAEIRAAVEAASDSNVFTDADHSKLNAIEASATADQTASEIRTLVESASDSNVFTDADHTKLNGIATSANNYSHPNHSGEVTSSGDGAMTIADNVVDEANLKISNSPTNGYFLQAQSGNTGGLTWAQVAEPDLTNLSASNLTSGTIPDARFPATFPTINGTNLTNLAASALSGTLPALDGSNLTNIASACTRVKVGTRESEYDLPHYNQGYLVIPGTNLQFTNVSSDNTYLIFHGYQLRSTNAPTHTRQSRTVNAYISGPTHGGVGHYGVYTANSWESYGPFMSINITQDTSDKSFGIYGRCTYYTDSYNSIRNVYLMVMEFKAS